jgi:L-ascorbate metabolism protein UlaG (beta-lactamase superfamily)
MRCSARIAIRLGVAAVLAALYAVALADVTITQLANEGVILADDGSARVMIDGMVVEPYSVYGGLTEEGSRLFYLAEGPFDGISLALASHRHHDHNQPGPACQFLQRSTGTEFVSSVQVMDLMGEKCPRFITDNPRIRIIEPREELAEVLEMDSTSVTAFPLSHGKGKYAKLQNFAHLVELGGLRILHLGDAAMEPENFSRAGVEKLRVDVVLIPYWYFQPGPGGDIVRRFLQAPHQIAVHIPPREMEQVQAYLQHEFPQVIVLAHTLDQVSFSATSPPLP